MEEGRKPEFPEKTPGDELQKMPHTTAQRFKPQARLEPAQSHWWQARKADMLTVTPRVAPSECVRGAARNGGQGKVGGRGGRGEGGGGGRATNFVLVLMHIKP